MDINRYLMRRRESQAAFAVRCGVDQRTINRICLGGSCNVATALAIIKASRKRPARQGVGGTVRLEDLA